MSYYVKVAGLKVNGKAHVLFRETREQAEEKASYYRRHGFKVTVGTVRPDGQLAKPRRVEHGANS